MGWLWLLGIGFVIGCFVGASSSSGDAKKVRKELEKEAKGLQKEREQLQRELQRHLKTKARDAERALKDSEKKVDGVVKRYKMLTEASERQAEKLAARLKKEVIKTVMSKVTINNFDASKKKINSLYDFCEKAGVKSTTSEQTQFLFDMKHRYEDVLRADFHKKEQARIKAQIREEQRAEKERQQAIQQAAKEQSAIEKALKEALSHTHDEHSREIELLRERLAEAEANSQRAVSQAQLTRAGHVYVISNIGSFGDTIFKIGMTRRLEPMDRVKELGDASVPFPYDVHMMISTDDAPALENALHRQFHMKRLNRINLRREFFKVTLPEIVEVVTAQQGDVDYVVEPEALQYYESINMTDEEFAELTATYTRVEREETGVSELDPVTLTVTDAAPAPPPPAAAPSPSPEQAPEPPPAVEEAPAPPAEETVPCPLCTGLLATATLVPGDNTCPHCTETFECG